MHFFSFPRNPEISRFLFFVFFFLIFLLLQFFFVQSFCGNENGRLPPARVQAHEQARAGRMEGGGGGAVEHLHCPLVVGCSTDTISTHPSNAEIVISYSS